MIRAISRSPSVRIVAIPMIAALIGACAEGNDAPSSEPAQTETGTVSQELSLLSVLDLLDDHNGQVFLNAEGASANKSSTGSIDRNNPFFASLGTNGRACVSCHVPGLGFSITPKYLQTLFEVCETLPRLAPSTLCAVFRTVDGSNSPTADVSTKAKRKAAYSMLLKKGLIRIPMKIRENAEFELVAADDPYGFASANELSLFRRPLPSTNLRTQTSIMWDMRDNDINDETNIGQQPPPDPNVPNDGFPGLPGDLFAPRPIRDVLKIQANNAHISHAQGSPLTDAQQNAIADFELALTSAQVIDKRAGLLDAQGAKGGTDLLSTQSFTYFRNFINFGPFDPAVFNIYTAWQTVQSEARKSIARGEVLFNTRSAPGIQEFGFDPNITFCGTCHNAENVGSISVNVPTHFPDVQAPQFRTPDMPLYTFKCSALGVARGACAPGQTHQTTDPGRGPVSGRWADLSIFKVPTMRNLAARAPYFHNGSAATLDDVLEQYRVVLGFQFTDAEKKDLINFMNSL